MARFFYDGVELPYDIPPAQIAPAKVGLVTSIGQCDKSCEHLKRKVQTFRYGIRPRPLGALSVETHRDERFGDRWCAACGFTGCGLGGKRMTTAVEGMLDLPTNAAAFRRGLASAPRSVLAYVVFATYLGIGALAHDYHFSLIWLGAATLLIWAGPAQVILITTLGSGATPVQAAIAVALSAIRLFPMVVSVLPMVRDKNSRLLHLVLPAHFTAVTFWVESFRLLPHVPRERRIAFADGFGMALISGCVLSSFVGYYMARELPDFLGAGVLFLTPIAFLLSTASNSRRLEDWLALGLGLIFTPLAALAHTGLDILVGGLAAGTLSYAIRRLRGRTP